MGMFDYLFIDTNMLPISDEEKIIIGNEPGWQTKDFYNTLTEIYITNDGELKNDQLKIITHNDVRFYSHINLQRYEFNATFTDGKLIQIKRTNTQTPNNNTEWCHYSEMPSPMAYLKDNEVILNNIEEELIISHKNTDTNEGK
jgi:hypothetical protein